MVGAALCQHTPVLSVALCFLLYVLCKCARLLANLAMLYTMVVQLSWAESARLGVAVRVAVSQPHEAMPACNVNMLQYSAVK